MLLARDININKIIVGIPIIILSIYSFWNNDFEFIGKTIVIESFDSSDQLVQLKSINPYSIARLHFDDWLTYQYDYSCRKILQNFRNCDYIDISNQLNFINEIPNGVIIASPSKSNPDYYYQWTRDSAITVISLNNQLIGTEKYNITVSHIILDYVNNIHILQSLDNRSGSRKNLNKNLGEPKFMVDNSPFNENWGRPQNDGPPLRALSVMKFLYQLKLNHVDINRFFKEHKTKLSFNDVNELFNDVIVKDIQFVLYHWDESSFDLWEEVFEKHYFTSLMQLYSLKLVQCFIKDFNIDLSKHQELPLLVADTIRHIEDLIVNGNFINRTKNLIVETPNNLHDRPSGIDIAVIIATVMTTTTSSSISQSSDALTFPVDVANHEIQNTLFQLIQSMKYLYPINHKNIVSNLGIGLGRYPEDIYDGVGLSEANPWFLSTAVASNYLYKLVHWYFNNRMNIIINDSNINFWSLILEFDKSLNPHTVIVIPFNSKAFNQTLSTLFNYSDSFLDKIRQHAGDEGQMSEQFNKFTGFLTGATDLTWSYGEFINTFQARSITKKFIP